MANRSKSTKSKIVSQSSKSTKSKLVTPSSKSTIEKMKYEIANEFGVKLGADSTAKANGSVGGEMTRRLVELGHSKINGNYNRQSK